MKALFFSYILLSTYLSFSQNLGLSEDKRDNKKYKTVVIGDQTWMAENLNASTFRNGDKIPMAKNEEDWWKASEEGKPIWSYYQFDSKNGNQYGKIYNWYAVNDPRGLSQEGWHIPSDQEWTIMENYLGGNENAGKKLKSTENWNSDGNGTNESGFSAIPVTGFNLDGGFYFEHGSEGNWWTSTESNSDLAFLRSLSNENDQLFSNELYKSSGFSVRCVKD